MRITLFILISSIGTGFFFNHTPTSEMVRWMAEDCANGKDDDEDGLIDLNDPDCDCKVAEPVSLIPNPSFEERDCCPSSYSQLHCAETWIQASEATTDYLHTCGWMGWHGLAPPLPFPDGDACIGFRNGRFGNEINPNWKEYTGACLTDPLIARTAYTFKFNIGFTNYQNSPPINIVFYGTTNCDNLPFGVGDDRFGCPTNDPNWIELGRVGASGNNTWREREITITPSQNIYAIAIGPDCVKLSRDSIDTYYFFDNLILADKRTFDYRVNTTHHPCAEDFRLTVPEGPDLTYQWYKDGVAIVGATDKTYAPKKSVGNYQAIIQDEQSCWLTPNYYHSIPYETGAIQPVICPDEVFDFHGNSLSDAGFYIDTIKSVHNCDSIVSIDLSIAEDKTVEVAAKIFEGEQYQVGDYQFEEAGYYEASLQTSYGCDSLVQLSLDYYNVYFPNAFSPNNDGINDYFTIEGNEDLRAITSFEIFNRWGASVYNAQSSSESDTPRWDGKSRTQPAVEGTYLYTATIVMDDGKERTTQGSFLLVR